MLTKTLFFRLFAATLLMTISLSASQAKSAKIKIIETTDVHGAFFPNMGKVCSYVKQQRQEYGDNLILLDGGDILQGEPCSYYYNNVDTISQNIAAKIINYMKYDAQTFGNHDVETGHKVYDKWASETNCPMLGANVINTKTGKPYLQPYAIFERDGVKIAVIGMLTPTISNWLNESLWKGLDFEDIATSCRKWVKIVRQQENPDFIIGLFHSGLKGGIVNSKCVENASEQVAREVEGFDAVMYGHDHQKYCTTVSNTKGKDVWLLNSGNKARRVAELTITINGKQRTLKGSLHDTEQLQPDNDFMQFFTDDMQKINDYMNATVGEATEDIHTKDAFSGCSSFTTFINQFQLDFTHADISITAPLVYNETISKGIIRTRDMYKFYPYENKLNVIKLSGDEIRKHLEYSYSKWVNTITSSDDDIFMAEGSRFLYPTYNFDSAAGINYTVDVTKPVGQRVVIQSMSDGTPFLPEKVYKVAMNSYRCNGGGEILTKGVGIDKKDIEKRIIYESERDIRSYLTEYIRQHKTIIPHADSNWKFIPETIAAPALKRHMNKLFNK